MAIEARPSGEWVWRKQIIAEMPALLTQLGAEERYKAASGYTIAAALAGMTMRRKPSRKESIIKTQDHGRKLALAEQYTSQIKQWLASQKLA